MFSNLFIRRIRLRIGCFLLLTGGDGAAAEAGGGRGAGRHQDEDRGQKAPHQGHQEGLPQQHVRQAEKGLHWPEVKPGAPFSKCSLSEAPGSLFSQHTGSTVKHVVTCSIALPGV